MPLLVNLNQKTTFKRKFQYRVTHDYHWRKMTLVAHFLQTVFFGITETQTKCLTKKRSQLHLQDWLVFLFHLFLD